MSGGVGVGGSWRGECGGMGFVRRVVAVGRLSIPFSVTRIENVCRDRLIVLARAGKAPKLQVGAWFRPGPARTLVFFGPSRPPGPPPTPRGSNDARRASPPLALAITLSSPLPALRLSPLRYRVACIPRIPRTRLGGVVRGGNVQTAASEEDMQIFLVGGTSASSIASSFKNPRHARFDRHHSTRDKCPERTRKQKHALKPGTPPGGY